MPDQFSWLRPHQSPEFEHFSEVFAEFKALLDGGKLSPISLRVATKALEAFVEPYRTRPATTEESDDTEMVDWLVDDLLRVLRDPQVNELSRTDISNLLWRNFPSKRITAALQLLADRGLVEKRKEQGRKGAPTTWWSAL